MEVTGAGVTGLTAQRAETKDYQLSKKTPEIKVKKLYHHVLSIFFLTFISD